MRLGDKIRYLREVEGSLRGLGRALTQQELVRELRAAQETPGRRKNGGKGRNEPGGRSAGLSQPYLSQIENGSRPHLTNATRMLLARFFKVHPGYLVDDPEGYHAELMSDVRTLEDKLDIWLIGGAERFRKDPELRASLLEVAQHADSRACLLLLGAILETPALAERLLELLRPKAEHGGAEQAGKAATVRTEGKEARRGHARAGKDGAR